MPRLEETTEVNTLNSASAMISDRKINGTEVNNEQRTLKEIGHSSSHLCANEITQNGKTLTILFENEDYIVVDKPFDIAINTMDSVSHPITVATLLESARPHRVDLSCVHKFRFVHRLDFSTSGVLCVALNKTAAAKLSAAFQQRRTVKEYIAVLRGRLHQSKLVDVPIGEDSRASHKMLPVHDEFCLSNTERSAKTEFEPIEYGLLCGTEVTKVRIRLFTGRRHQIRVHALYIGHPVLGDYTYTNDDTSPRMFLHAKKLSAQMSPTEQIEVESSLDFVLENAVAITRLSDLMR